MHFLLVQSLRPWVILHGCARDLFSQDWGRDRGVDNSSRGETETKAFRARDWDEAYQLWGETEPKHYCTSRPPWGQGVKTEATSHIHIIPRTDVVLKRSGGSLELRLNRSGIFKHNFMYVMLTCQGCTRGLFSRDRGETESLKAKTEAEARPRPRR